MAYVSLPGARIPGNAMLDFSPLVQTIGANRQEARQNAMDAYQQKRDKVADARYADQRSYSRGRDAISDARYDDETKYTRGRQTAQDQRAAESHGWERDQQTAQRRQRATESMAGVANIILQSPAELRGAQYQQFRQAIPGFDEDMTAAGFDPNNWEVTLPAIVAKARGLSSGGEDFSKREGAARTYGLDPNSDAGRAFILTGKLPREDQQALTATDKKAILEADEMVSINRGAINALDEASRLSPQAYDGMLASQRAWVANNLAPWETPQAEATANLDNAVVGNALSQLKAIFGAAPTEGERKILLDLQGSANQPAPVREAIYERARAAAIKRLDFNQDRATQLRGGTFYKPQGAPGQAQPAPAGVGNAPIRARNPQTGETIEWDGTKWAPAQ